MAKLYTDRLNTCITYGLRQSKGRKRQLSRLDLSFICIEVRLAEGTQMLNTAIVQCILTKTNTISSVKPYYDSHTKIVSLEITPLIEESLVDIAEIDLLALD